jgi:predicted outer membrane protein
MGELAQKNGQSDAVKSFGRMLTEDHAAANQKATQVARPMGVNPPNGPNKKQQTDHDKMAKATDLLSDMPSFIRRVCCGYAPVWGVLRTRLV